MTAGRGHLSLAAALKWRGFQLAGIALRHSEPAATLLPPLAGGMAYALARGRRHAVEANLGDLLPDASRTVVRQKAIGVFRSVARYYVELMRLPIVDARVGHDDTIVEGYELFEAARAAGKGVIVAGIHLGPAELLLQSFASRGITYTAMIERLQPQLNALFLQARQRPGQRYVYADLAGLRALLKALRAGQVVALLVDRDVTGSGGEVPFAGRTVRAAAGVIELARASGAPIVPAIAQWTDTGKRAIFLQPITVERATRGQEALRDAMAALLSRFLPYLRARPEDWLMLERWFVDPASASGAGYTGNERPPAAGREGRA
mgnify:CR=1 FL=1